MPKLLVICGPTASGKTALALSLAKKFRGDILSADSRQVYKGMDIVTGKDLPVNAKLQITNLPAGRQGVKWGGKRIGFWETAGGARIWLVDLAEPWQSFSVSQWVGAAQRVIPFLWKEKKLPIVVGTAGFYIKALLDGIETLGIPPSLKLRGELSGENADELFEMLQKIDHQRATSLNKSDRKNPRRLVRAIEVALGRSNSSGRPAVLKGLDADILTIGLTAPREVLHKKIDERVDERVERGALDEVKRLLAEGVSWDNESMTGTGYRQLRPYFGGKITLKEAMECWKIAEHQDSKKQMTWFKKDKRIRWFDMTQPGWEEQVEKLVRNWYYRGNSLTRNIVTCLNESRVN